MKSLRVNKKWLSDFEKAQSNVDDLEVLFDFYKEGDSTAEEVEKQFELACTNSKKYCLARKQLS